MGYYSNVKIFIKENKDIDLKQVYRIAKSLDGDKDNIQLAISDDDEKVLIATYNDYKWYDCFDLVKFWDQIIDTITDSNNYLYCEQGEDWNDIIRKGTFGYAEIYTNIEYEVDIKKYII